MSYYVLVRGPLGVGKTTVAQRLAEVCDADYISIDQILDDHGLWEAGELSEFLRANSIAVRRARGALAAGIPVVFDGNFYWRPQIEDLESQLEFPHTVFTLEAPLEVCVERDAQRDSPHGAEAARAVYQKTHTFECGIVIDATQSVELAVRDMITRLDRGSGHPEA